MRAFLLFLAALACVLVTATAQAAVRRCIAADGTTIYTDRSCEHFDAREVQTQESSAHMIDGQVTTPIDTPLAEPPLSSYGPVATDCPRTPELLLASLRRMLETRDINGLAGLYHWPGMGKWSARSVMDRLEMIVAQSDGSAELLYPDAAFVVYDPQAYPGLPPEDPLGVRIMAFHEGGISQQAPELATLGVIRHAGCWWLHF